MAKPSKSAKPQISLDDIAVKGPAKSKSKNPVLGQTGEDSIRLIQFNRVRTERKALETREAELGGAIRELAMTLWVDRAMDGQTENLKLVADAEDIESPEDRAEVTYIVMDSYSKVTEEARTSIIEAGLGDYIEKDCIQLSNGLTDEMQQRVLNALVAEFGIEKARELVYTQYKVRKGSLLEVVATRSKKMIVAAFDLLRPTTQLR